MVRQTIQIAYLGLTGGLWKVRGRTEVHMMLSPSLGQTRQVIVYLPAEYDRPENRDRHYPVLYLLHGFPDPGDGWVRFGLSPQLVDKAIVNKDLPPLLVVMADAHGALGKFGDSEYLNAPEGDGKAGTRVADFISHDLPAWVDAHYRTLPDADGRFLAGSSTGGYAALNIGLKHPATWGTLIAFSGYFNADLDHFGRALWGTHPDPAQIRAESPIYFVRAAPNPAWHKQFVYLGNGLRDYAFITDQTQQLADELSADGVPLAHHRLAGHHSWDLWRALLVDGLETVKPRLLLAAARGVAQRAPDPPRSAAPLSTPITRTTRIGTTAKP